MDHEEYLKQILKEKKLKLESLHIKHQVEIAVYESQRNVLMSDINSLQKQLFYEDAK